MQPDVHVNTLSSTAGLNLSVKCNFTIPDKLFRAPSVQWVDSSGLVVSATHNLTFSPLLTSNGGKYTCNVTINITELNITLTGIGNINITVQSKFSGMLSFYSDHCLPLTICCTVPSPTVDITTVGMPYIGSEYILTCIVGVNDAVNTNITISSQWLNGTGPVLTESTISINSERIMDLEHRHNLTFRPLRSRDERKYTCNASITQEDSNFIEHTSVTENDMIDVAVESKL